VRGTHSGVKNRWVKLLQGARNAGLLIAITLLLFDTLFRVNLSKHLWLIGVQAGLALFVVLCTSDRGVFNRNKRMSETLFEQTATTRQPPGSLENSLIQRGVGYFGMASAVELIAAVVLLSLLIFLTVLNVFRVTVNSDEPQHLHTIWGWTRGFIQYRDLFDNHMPLFHVMFAPIFALIGERATIVYWMRLVLLPMNFVAAFCTYQIGTTLFSRRAGVWALLSVGLFNGYYRDVTDFAPSNLWLPLWLLCIAALISGKMNTRRALVAGLLLGSCFAVSMKSAVFFASIVVGTLCALALMGRKELSETGWGVISRGAAFVFGTALIPAAVMIFFAGMGVWREFRFAVFDFNFLANRFYENRIIYGSHPLIAFLILAAVVAPALFAGRWIAESADSRMAKLRRLFVLFTCAAYFFVMQVFWAPISRTYRPIYPLVFALATGALLVLGNDLSIRSRIRGARGVLPLPAFVAVAELLSLLAVHPFLRTSRKSESELLHQVLILTTLDDYVLDSKGETIFRKRASPLIMERITNKAIQHGMLVDDAPQRCVQTRTCVVSTVSLRSFSTSTRRFIERNYLPVSETLRVAGTKLTNPIDFGRCDFDIVIPALYKIVSSSGAVAGILDGATYDRPRFLEPGRHSFESKSTGTEELFCVWSRAVDSGFVPFALPAGPGK
jgi:hypothetical protein